MTQDYTIMIIRFWPNLDNISAMHESMQNWA